MSRPEAWVLNHRIHQYPLAELDVVPDESYVWLLVPRDDFLTSLPFIEKLAQSQLNEQHIKDALNGEHPSFFDTTEQYEMVVFRGVASSQFEIGGIPRANLTFASVACFNFDKILLTVYDQHDLIIDKVKEFISRTTRSATMTHPSDLAYLILDAIIDQSLFLRNPLSQQLTEWQNLMLEKNNRFHAWNEFMGFKNIVEQLTLLSEDQDDTIENWRKYSRHVQQQQFNINLNDLSDHIERCDRHLLKLTKSLDMLLQLHFSAMSHRNNEVLRILAIISCVFLPLTLITGIFGMNFEHMPVLHQPHAYDYTMGVMLTIAGSLLLLFKWRRWL